MNNLSLNNSISIRRRVLAKLSLGLVTWGIALTLLLSPQAHTKAAGTCSTASGDCSVSINSPAQMM